MVQMSLTKLFMLFEMALTQFFNSEDFFICVLLSKGKMAPNSTVSQEFTLLSNEASRTSHRGRTTQVNYEVSKGTLKYSDTRKKSLDRRSQPVKILSV